MTILITAAGRSRRFTDAGVSRPKWALELGGRSMLARAVDSVITFVDDGHELRIVVTADQLDELGSCAHELPPFSLVVVDRQIPPGQAVDALTAMRDVDLDAPLIIFNSDTLIHTTNLASRVASAAGDDAWLVLAQKPGTQWSFAELSKNQVLRCAEKERISPYATAGLYGFATGSQYMKAVERSKLYPGGEMYVAPLYNELIAAGDIVRPIIVDSDDMESVGTPDELLTACARHHWTMPKELL